jgi:hypothetical protein
VAQLAFFGTREYFSSTFGKYFQFSVDQWALTRKDNNRDIQFGDGFQPLTMFFANSRLALALLWYNKDCFDTFSLLT